MKILIDVLVLVCLGGIIWLGFKFDVMKYQKRHASRPDYRLCNDGQYRVFTKSYDSLIAENSTHPVARDQKHFHKQRIAEMDGETE